MNHGEPVAATPSWVKRPLEFAVLEEESPDLEAENARLREALTYYAEGRYPDGGEIARETLSRV
jgi:hypothetical protein